MEINKPVNIAIVGISAELPSGTHFDHNLNHKQFFQFLLDGKESYENIPSNRFNIEAWKGNGIAHVSVNKASFLKDIDLFDNVEFGISSKDAHAMAPVTRKLIENAFLALLDSGIDYRTRKVGVYTSGNNIDIATVGETDEYDLRGSFSGTPCQVANRISNHLDLLGPSLPVDTACSSSLTAFHLAVQAIVNGDCEAAVVGGAQINHRFMEWITYTQGSLLAKDGKCKPFDAGADGFARSEACVAVILKPLEDAIRDSDKIYGTVLGTAINSTGAGGPPAAPIAEYQRDAMIHAFARAGVSPREVDFAELHATGTAKGDPTEVNWVAEHFSREKELVVGSVKANIGHAEIVSFLASLSKVLSIMETGVIPPQPSIKKLNPAIDWEGYRLKVPLVPTPLPDVSGGRKLFAMAGSGIGGSNGHVVLQGPPAQASLDNIFSNTQGPHLIFASGLSPRTVAAVAETMDEAVKTNDRAVLSTVLGRRTKQMTWRSYAIAHPDSDSPLKFTPAVHCNRISNPVVFVFSGQGPQHKEMGRQLFQRFPVYRDSIIEMDETYLSLTGKSMIHDYGLFGGAEAKSLPNPWPISLILPSIAIFQIALFDLLIALGVNPDYLIGHSAGETACLYASGAAPKAMAVELAVIRGTTFTQIESHGGTMAALSCNAEVAQEMLSAVTAELPTKVVEIACLNSANAVAIAGHIEAVDKVLAFCDEKGIFARKIQTRVPIHSSMMEACKDEYVPKLHALFRKYPGIHKPQIPTYSTLEGDLYEGHFHADYYWSTTRGQVKFAPAIEDLAKGRNLTFVELAPHPVLSSYVSSMVGDSSPVINTVRRPKTGTPSAEFAEILELCGKLTVAGHNFIDFTALNGRACYENEVELPPYPFVKKQYLLYPRNASYVKQMEPRLGPLNHKYLKINKDTHTTLGEHVIRGEPIMPAAGYIEMAFEFGATMLLGVNMISILSLSSEDPVKVNVELDGSHWSVKSLAPSKNTTLEKPLAYTERMHADGFLSFETPHPVPDMDIPAIRNRMSNHIGSEFYETLSYFSAYGPLFQRVTNFYYTRDEALVSIRGLDEALAGEGNYILHPSILDACFHATAFKPFHGIFDPNVYHLPQSCEAIVIHKTPKAKYFPKHIYCYAKITEWRPDGMSYDMNLLTTTGEQLVSLRNFKVARHKMNALPEMTRAYEVVYQHAVQPIRKGYFMKPIVSDVPFTPAVSLNPAARDFSALVKTAVEDDCKCALAQAAASLATALEKTVARYTSRESSRVIRLLLSSTNDALFAPITVALSKLPNLFFEIFISNNDVSKVPLDRARGTVRSFNPKMSAEESSELGVFDIVVALNITNGAGQFAAVAQAYSDLLGQGGTLIVSDHRCREVASSMMEVGRNVHMLGNLTSLSNANLAILEGDDVFGANFATFECQKRSIIAKSFNAPQVFDEAESFVFHYTLGTGGEGELHKTLMGFDQDKAMNIWIIAKEGRAAGAASGIARTLKREFLFWTTKMASFPVEFDEDKCFSLLKRIPISLKDEDEFVFTPSGEILVPRVVPLEQAQSNYGYYPFDSLFKLDESHVLLNICSSVDHGNFSAYTAIIVSSGSTAFPQGTFVAGLASSLPDVATKVHVSSLSPIPAAVSKNSGTIVDDLAGYVASVLALGAKGLSPARNSDTRRILITHSDTPIGSSITRLFSNSSIKYQEATGDTLAIDLVSLGFNNKFDLIISGYKDREHIQILESLTVPNSGELFLWNSGLSGIPKALGKNSWAIGDSLATAFSTVGGSQRVRKPSTPSTPISRSPSLRASKSLSHAQAPRHARFDPDKTYVVLGGIGSLGAQIALLMHQRGAKHIILTSRSGEKSLADPKHHLVNHIIQYLRREKVGVRLEPVDALSPPAMTTFFSSLTAPLGGVMILTAVLRDSSYQYQDQASFDPVFKAKLGVLDVLKESIDIESLEFLIGFSSVAGTFTSGGQANYAAANCALEWEFRSIRNGYAFICPGVLDSTLMHAGEFDAESRFSNIIDWSMSLTQTLGWLEDSLYRLQCGQRFTRYIPNLDWEGVDRSATMTTIGRHLVQSVSESESSTEEGGDKIAEIVRRVLNVSAEDFSPEVPFTSYGIDSLSASKLSFLLRSHVLVSQFQLLADICLNDLHNIATESAGQQEGGAVAEIRSFGALDQKVAAMQTMLGKYTKAMYPVFSANIPSRIIDTDMYVLLTGTTGQLGCNILGKLLENPRVRRIYAFNRKSRTSLLDRQAAAFEIHGFPRSNASSPKLVLLEGDLNAEDFGVGPTTFHELSTTVSHIIHNAWKVDFYIDLAGFEPLIAGTRSLIDFAANSMRPTPPSISFISTTGVYQDMKNISEEACPEAPIFDPKVSAMAGYCESKWVAERIVQLAGQRMGLKTNVIRGGLISGGSNGMWDTAHYIPAMAQTALYLDCLPDGNDHVHWIPVDIAASAIVDMQDSFGQTFHLVHPRPVKWSEVTRPLSEMFNVPLVPYEEWCARLEAATKHDSTSIEINGTKVHKAAFGLVDIFRMGLSGLPKYETMGMLPKVSFDHAVAASRTLQDPNISRLGKEHAQKWVSYWRSVGFLPSQ